MYITKRNLEVFSFRKCQEPVRSETTKDSSSVFIGYRIPLKNKMAAQSYSQGINQLKNAKLFRYSHWLSRYPQGRIQHFLKVGAEQEY